MKKIILLALVMLFTTTIMYAQEAQAPKWEQSLTASFSFENASGSKIGDKSFYSLEYGISKNNLGAFISAGRSVTNGTFSKCDRIGDYWVGIGGTASKSIGNVDVYGILGVGSLLQSKGFFIEYGGGFTTPLYKKVSVGGKLTNWAGTTYVSPTVSVKL